MANFVFITVMSRLGIPVSKTVFEIMSHILIWVPKELQNFFLNKLCVLMCIMTLVESQRIESHMGLSLLNYIEDYYRKKW